MPTVVFKSIKLDIKRDLLDRIIDSYLSGGNSITRIHVADSCGVSRTSSGKVASALTASGFMTEKTFSDRGERPSIHLFPTENFNVLLIDLSSARYSMSIVSTDNKCLFSQSYMYDAEICYEDNLNIFLSRSGYAMHQSKKPYAAICVIYSDLSENNRCSLAESQVYLPSISNKDKTDKSIYSVFRRYPDTYIGISSAICAAAKYGVIARTDSKESISYLFTGSYLCAFNASNNNIRSCDLSSLIIKDDATVKMMMSKRLSPGDLELLLTRAVNFMKCAYGSDRVIVDSDIYNIDQDIAVNISRNFAKIGEFTPELILPSASPSIKQSGAVKHTFALTVKRFLIPENNRTS